MLLLSAPEEKTSPGIFAVTSTVFGAGILHQLFSGDALGNPVVGLQWAFYEYKRKNLSSWRRHFRKRWNGAGLLSSAFV